MSENYSRALKRRRITDESSDDESHEAYQPIPHYEVDEPMFHNSWSDLEYSDEDEDIQNEFEEIRNQHQPP